MLFLAFFFDLTIMTETRLHNEILGSEFCLMVFISSDAIAVSGGEGIPSSSRTASRVRSSNKTMITRLFESSHLVVDNQCL